MFCWLSRCGAFVSYASRRDPVFSTVPYSVVLVRVLSADLHLLGFSGERAQRQARLLAHLVLSLIEEAQTLPLLDPEGAHTYSEALERYREDMQCAVDSIIGL